MAAQPATAATALSKLLLIPHSPIWSEPLLARANRCEWLHRTDTRGGANISEDRRSAGLGFHSDTSTIALRQFAKSGNSALPPLARDNLRSFCYLPCSNGYCLHRRDGGSGGPFCYRLGLLNPGPLGRIASGNLEGGECREGRK